MSIAPPRGPGRLASTVASPRAPISIGARAIPGAAFGFALGQGDPRDDDAGARDLPRRRHLGEEGPGDAEREDRGEVRVHRGPRVADPPDAVIPEEVGDPDPEGAGEADRRPRRDADRAPVGAEEVAGSERDQPGRPDPERPGGDRYRSVAHDGRPRADGVDGPSGGRAEEDQVAREGAESEPDAVAAAH